MVWWLAACGGDGPQPRDTDPDPGSATTAHTGTPEVPTPTGATASTAATADTGTAPVPLDDYRSPGPFAVDRTERSSTATSCRSMDLVRFAPVGGPGGHVVVLAHGFAGRKEDVVGWGEHLASWGLTALVPDLCHSGPFTVDHEQNGLDLVALAAAEAPGDVPWYVGYSAGGLAALVAATRDPAAGGHLGLDTVDAFGVGAAAGPALSVPSADLYAEPSACNSRNNGVPIYDAAGVETVHVVDADHCDWTNPPDPTCARVCATGPDTASIPATITTLVTSWLLWRAARDAEAHRWWTPGEDGRERLLSDGWIEG